MPSSFHSIAASPVRANASVSVGADCASIGRTGTPTTSWNRPSPALPCTSTASATGRNVPATVTARRTSAAGTSAAVAMASVSTPSSAPWRSSPLTRPASSRCSVGVARAISARSRPRRAVVEPAPLSAEIRSNSASTSRTCNDGCAAGGGRSRSAAYPRPVRRWRNSPDRNATTIGTSSGPARRRQSASNLVLASRPGVSATAAEVWARSSSSTTAESARHHRPRPPSPVDHVHHPGRWFTRFLRLVNRRRAW